MLDHPSLLEMLLPSKRPIPIEEQEAVQILLFGVLHLHQDIAISLVTMLRKTTTTNQVTMVVGIAQMIKMFSPSQQDLQKDGMTLQLVVVMMDLCGFLNAQEDMLLLEELASIWIMTIACIQTEYQISDASIRNIL